MRGRLRPTALAVALALGFAAALFPLASQRERLEERLLARVAAAAGIPCPPGPAPATPDGAAAFGVRLEAAPAGRWRLSPSPGNAVLRWLVALECAAVPVTGFALHADAEGATVTGWVELGGSVMER
ncbi:MAG: hypothetical protein KatS3mg124_1441 [Porticoccaceae bacterium]|nr:MAG: hypothetical protein KatS3mg124_1441 [Porticoccaceae bacterium]